MKRYPMFLGVVLAIGLLCSVASAQSPYINGVGMADYSTPLIAGHWWSIYGTNLSPGTNAGVQFNYAIQEGCCQIYNIYNYDCCGTGDQSPYWYESYSQINFYAETAPPVLVSQGVIEVDGSYGGSNIVYVDFQLS